jgi:hypothetical protein
MSPFAGEPTTVSESLFHEFRRVQIVRAGEVEQFDPFSADEVRCGSLGVRTSPLGELGPRKSGEH